MTMEIDFRSEEGNSIRRLVWSTDLHLDAMPKGQLPLFFELLAAFESDAVLIGGDISNGVGSLQLLESLQKHVDKPFYFVLGNHDYYYGSIEAIRKEARALTARNPNICYLSNSEIVPLTPTTALIGHDGWSDGRAGDYENSDVLLNDYFLIEELKKLNPQERLEKLNRLGEEAADLLEKRLRQALESFQNVVLLTHVPPFEEACVYDGIGADPNWTPHFVGKLTGMRLEAVMKASPDKRLLILCGHAHWGNDVQILPNLRVVTGHSELGNPNVQGLLIVN